MGEIDRGAFTVVDALERKLCEYTGAPFCVTTDSCTNALFLAFRIKRPKFTGELWLPKHTYVGVYQAAINAGFRVLWSSESWRGQYLIRPVMVMDSARRFTSGMYCWGTLQCLSFQASKILPIGRGGAILCDREEDAEWLRRARFDGRNQNESLYHQVEFQEGWHMYMDPEDAARGLWLMMSMPKHNPDQEAEYPDLSDKVWRA